MIRRRTFISLLTGGLPFLALRSFAQPVGRIVRVGYLSLLSPDPTSSGGEFFRGIREELAKRGYVVGRNIVFEERYALGQADKLPALAADLAESNVDVIVAGPTTAIRAAHVATTKIPIVMAFSGDDPVKSGFVKSLARPGTNVTGVTAQVRDIAPKWVELLRNVVGSIERVAVLTNPAQPEHASYLSVMQETLPAGMRLQIAEVRQRQYEEAFAGMRKEHTQGLVILGNVLFTQDSGQLADLALSYRLPSVYLFKAFPDAGGLMSYGPSHHEIFDLAAEYIDRILKGSRPGELPVRQPTKFELVINAKTAKTLGITIPQPLLLLANEVIQ